MGSASPNCPVCGGTQARRAPGPREVTRFDAQDLRITDHRYGSTLPLWRCDGCGFLYADPAVAHELEQHYEALEDPDYEATQAPRRVQLEGLWLQVERAFRQHRGRTPKSVLDVGAATGLLVEIASQRGVEALGIEPSTALSEVAQRHGRPVVAGTWPLPHMEARRFDVVTLVDVIEHVADPLALLVSAEHALTPEGVVVVVTPDLESLAARILGRRWWHFRVAHVGYFSPSTFERLAQRAGLRPAGGWWARWHFPVDYLAERLAHYLPMQRIPGARHLTSLPGVNTVAHYLGSVTVPVQLFDSRVFLLEKGTARG